MKRAALWVLGVLILTAVLVVGLSQAGGEDPVDKPARFSLDAAKRELAGAPAPLAALHAEAAALLDGGVPAFRERLRELRGYPVVINKWASWCNPCRAEFPAFQRISTRLGKEVAFLGVNGHDSQQPARRFLEQYPVPFPSYADPDEKIARAIRAPANYPITVFVDKHGKTALIHQGGYTSAQALEADIEQYLGE